MLKKHHSLLTHHNKKGIQTLPAIILILFLIVLNTTGKQISFFIPEDHEKYGLIDSLYVLMDSSSHVVIKLENRLIKDKAIRHDKLTVKEQYFNYLLKHKLSTNEKILEYCKAVKYHNNVKMNYFNELLSALEGDIRAKCFILWKNARTELAQISDIVHKFDVSESNNSSIQYSNKELENDQVEIEEPSVDDILGPDIADEEEDYENPFAGMEKTMIKLERDDPEDTDSE